MIPTVLIASSVLDDGTEFSLVRRGDDWTVRVGSMLLMSNKTHASEDSLATEALARVPGAKSVLVGGLGLGYTLRAVLDRISGDSHVAVCELVPAMVEWNRLHVGALAGHPLEDPRTQVIVGDVLDHLRQLHAVYDVILLDVDNGPSALSSARNQRLYSDRGIRGCLRALRPGGVLAVWSAGPCARYERALQHANCDTEVLRVPAFTSGSASHVVFIGRPRS